jgi:hypothetical protein
VDLTHRWFLAAFLICHIFSGKVVADDVDRFFAKHATPLPLSTYFMTWALWPWVVLVVLSYSRHQRMPRWAPPWMLGK